MENNTKLYGVNKSLFISLLLFATSSWAQTGAQTGAQTESLQELLNRKQYAAVIARSDNLTAADSSDFGKMNALAQAYEGMLKYRDALRFYNQCFEMDTTNMDVLYALARTETNLGKGSQAERYYKKVLAVDSTDFYANYQLARLYFQMAEYWKAIDQYGFLLQQDPDNSALLRNLGDCHLRLNELMNASTYYSSAFDTNRENVGLASGLINTLLRLGPDFVKDALDICDTALVYNPESRQLRQNKGMALFVNRDYAQADTVYTSLLLEGDSSIVTLTYDGFSRYYTEKYFDAIEVLEPAYVCDTTAIDVTIYLGVSLGKTYDRKRAYTLFNQAEQLLQPDSGKMLLLNTFRANLLRRDQRNNEAAAVYYKLWKDYPARINYLREIALLHYASSADKYKDENARQRGLFGLVTYAREYIKTERNVKNLSGFRKPINSFIEDAFFRNEKELSMIAPDGKKSKITVDELRAIIIQIPDLP
jgi:tetratricopeptide (TPR) repeat protein